MARNKYPEETVNKILGAAKHLFMEKGYARTSVQDIVESLGLSKGAVYHHFKDKQELLEKVCLEYYSDMEWFRKIAGRKDLNGLQKLRKLLAYSLGSEEKQQIDSMAMEMMKNPQMIEMQLRSAVSEDSGWLIGLIEEGNRDGSMHVEQPKEIAEVVMILMNLWLNPAIFHWSEEEFVNRLRLVKTITDTAGMELVDSRMLETVKQYYAGVTKPKG